MQCKSDRKPGGVKNTDYEYIFVAKVFDFTTIADDILDAPNVYCGGTGFFFDKATPLPYEIEHHMPDYHLYDSFISHDTKHVKQKSYWKDYQGYSIGFATRGCFRQCKFCVNQNYKKVEFHAHVSEFFDPESKGIILLDDNILGYPKWKEVFAELEATGKPFVFKQGMDLRIMTEEKARILGQSHYMGEYIFAFDNPEDAEVIEKKLIMWRNYCSKSTKLYVLCGFEGQGPEEIDGIFKRIEILGRYKCLPYIMRHKNYLGSEYEGMFIQIARWVNQPNMFKKITFREFINKSQSITKTEGFISSALRALQKFESDYPEIGAKWFDRCFWDCD